MIRSSRTIRFRTSFLASTCIIWWAVSRASTAVSSRQHRTFLAMTTFVAACCTLLTVPPFPDPSSRRTIKSSAFRSKRNSTPISSVSARLSSFRGACESPAAGAGFGGGALRARPLTFFLFIVFVLNAESAMMAVWGRRRCCPDGLERLDGLWRLEAKARWCFGGGRALGQLSSLVRIWRPTATTMSRQSRKENG